MQRVAFCIQSGGFLWKKKFIIIYGNMTKFTISADVRAVEEKTSHIRKEKKVPGIVYGKSQEPISLVLDGSEFLKLYRKAWESNIIDLKVGKQELEVLVHQTQKHPVTGIFTHVDFYAITRGEALQTKIHFNFIGDAPAVKEGAIIEESMKEIEVKCLPRNLVDHFDVDLSLLKEAGDAIRVSDLGLDSEKYEIIWSEDDLIAAATLPRAVVAEEDEGGEGEETEWTQEGESSEEWSSDGEES